MCEVRLSVPRLTCGKPMGYAPECIEGPTIWRKCANSSRRLVSQDELVAIRSAGDYPTVNHWASSTRNGWSWNKPRI